MKHSKQLASVKQHDFDALELENHALNKRFPHLHACKNTYIHTYIHIFICSYVHIIIHICTHIYIYIYILSLEELQNNLRSSQKELATKDHDIYEKERLILDRNKEKIELESKLKEVQKNLDSKQKERDKYALNDIKRQELLDAEQSKLQQIQLDHDTVVSDLENDINRLMEELEHSKEETRKTQELAKLKSQQNGRYT